MFVCYQNLLCFIKTVAHCVYVRLLCVETCFICKWRVTQGISPPVPFQVSPRNSKSTKKEKNQKFCSSNQAGNLVITQTTHKEKQGKKKGENPWNPDVSMCRTFPAWLQSGDLYRRHSRVLMLEWDAARCQPEPTSDTMIYVVRKIQKISRQTTQSNISIHICGCLLHASWM